MRKLRFVLAATVATLVTTVVGIIPASAGYESGSKTCSTAREQGVTQVRGVQTLKAQAPGTPSSAKKVWGSSYWTTKRAYAPPENGGGYWFASATGIDHDVTKAYCRRI